MSSKMKAAWSSKTGGWVAAGVLAVALVVMLVAIGLRLTGSGDDSSSGRGSGPGGRGVPASSLAGDRCDVAEGDQSWRAPAPKDLTWKSAQGLSWPVSASVGPTKKVKGFDACFAHSPQGAALFSVTMAYSRYAEGVDPDKAYRFYLSDGPQKEELAKKGPGSASAPDARKAGMSVVGYYVDSFSKNKAKVHIVLSIPQLSPEYAAVPMQVVWDGNDWKVDSSSKSESAVRVQDGQFVKWSS